jgi:hypothetical protein
MGGIAARLVAASIAQTPFDALAAPTAAVIAATRNSWITLRTRDEKIGVLGHHRFDFLRCWQTRCWVMVRYLVGWFFFFPNCLP